MKDWSDEEINNFINTNTNPDPKSISKSSDFEKKISLMKKMTNDIYKEACSLTMDIINKHFNLQTFDATDKVYKNTNDNCNFCLIPLSSAQNKESFDRLLNKFKKLTKTLWPSITLINHNNPIFPNQNINPTDPDIKYYKSTLDFYHSDKIIKRNTLNNAIELRTGQKL